MSTPLGGSAKDILERVARRVMKERSFLTDFSRAVLDELRDRGVKARE